MMRLSQIVRVNEKGLVADAVNFGMMVDQEKNLSLCEGFIFSFDTKQPKVSTVGILDQLRRSFHSPNEPNIHLVVQDYGKGKSHFALVMANFFSKPFESPEVQGILNQIKNAMVGSKSEALLEGLIAFKQRNNRHLVVCLSGERGDLKRLLLNSLYEVLEAEGITETLAQRFCSTPLHFLEGLTEDEQRRVNEYLSREDNQYGDIKTVIKLLREADYTVVSLVKEISRQISRHGLPIDFQAGLDVEEVLQDLIDKLCTGQNPKYAGVLILVDELNAYLQTWASNPAVAGGMVLQNITNVCENNKQRIALLSLTQIRPQRASAKPISSNEIESYNKLTSRLERAESTYEPISSLEMVLDRLLIQEAESLDWKTFAQQAMASLKSDGEKSYRYATKYRETNWSIEDFHKHLTIGCFPLYPLTSYLLCNLDFTQGRTAIQFIKSEVKEFIKHQACIDHKGKPNYIYPYELIDAFLSNFSNYSAFTDFQKAFDAVQSSATVDQKKVLKGLFLFYVSGEKISKPDKEGHEYILTHLCGISTGRVKEALRVLVDTHGVIYHIGQNDTYRFYAGFGISDLKRSIEAEISGKTTTINEVVDHCRKNIDKYLTSKTIPATYFTEEVKLNEKSWQFERQVYTREQFEKVFSNSWFQTEQKGLVVYILLETPEEAKQLRKEITLKLKGYEHGQKLVIALPELGTEDLAHLQLQLRTLNEKVAEREKYGPAHGQLVHLWTKEIEERLKEIFSSCSYYSIVSENLPLHERQNLNRIISTLLKNLYPYAPPDEKNDKMQVGSTKGSQITGYIAKQLILNNLTPQQLPDKSYLSVIDPIFVERWKLLKKTPQKYLIELPTHRSIREAWDSISLMTELSGQKNRKVKLSEIWKKLSNPPFGYDEFTFIVLLSAWLAHHRSEVSISGPNRISTGRKNPPEYLHDKPIDLWAKETQIFEKPKDFVNEWLASPNALLIRKEPLRRPQFSFPIEYDQAKQVVDQLGDYIQWWQADLSEKDRANKDINQLLLALKQIDQWLDKGVTLKDFAEKANLEDLLTQIYPKRNILSPTHFQSNRSAVIQPTKQQIEQQEKILLNICQRIEKQSSQLASEADRVQSETTFGEYKTKVIKIIECLKQYPDLPLHLQETLQIALEQADRKIRQVKEQNQIESCLDQIRMMVDHLGENATQDDYSKAIISISDRAEKIPAVKQTEDYGKIVRQLEQQQAKLRDQIQAWETQCAEASTIQKASLLRDEILKYSNQYTEKSSQNTLRQVLERLQEKIQTLNESESLQKGFQTHLQEISQKIQRIEDSRKFPEAFNVYLDLIETEISDGFEKFSDITEYNHRLEESKSKADQKIFQKLEQLLSHKLERLQDFDFLIADLNQAFELINSWELFSEAKLRIESALQKLDEQYKKLEGQARDEGIIQTIRRIKPENISKIANCVDCIREIEQQQKLLQYPEKYKSEISQQIQKLQTQIDTFRKNLQESHKRYLNLKNLRELEAFEKEFIRLGIIFEDSDDFVEYQQLQNNIENLRADFRLLQSLEETKAKDGSIILCEAGLSSLLTATDNFHNWNRFEKQVREIESHFLTKKKYYVTQLDKFSIQLKTQQLTEIESFSRELYKKDHWFQGSDEEKRYINLCSDVDCFNQLIKVSPNKKPSTIQECDKYLTGLNEWKKKHKKVSPHIEERFKSCYQEVEQRKAVLVANRQKEAQKWIMDLEKQFAHLEQNQGEVGEIEKSRIILDEIRKKANSHQDAFLHDPLLEQKLKELENRCSSLQNSTREHQIIAHFQQLPSYRQEALLEQLKRFLDKSLQEKLTAVDL